MVRAWREVQHSDLIRTVECGIVLGEPRELYLVLPTAFGDFLGWDRPEVSRALQAMWEVLEGIDRVSRAFGAVQATRMILQRLRKRSARRAQVLTQHAASWQQRNAAPVEMFEVLTMKDWRAEEIASLLNCSPTEAEATLWSFGFSFDKSNGRWHFERTEEDRFFSGELQIGIWDRAGLADSKDRERLVERTQRYLETGMAPEWGEYIE